MKQKSNFTFIFIKSNIHNHHKFQQHLQHSSKVMDFLKKFHLKALNP
jgi:hypothetical protein